MEPITHKGGLRHSLGSAEPRFAGRNGGTMQIGLGIPHLGHFADPDATRTVALAAEDGGFSSLWAMDRLLSPVEPRTFAYPGSGDGALPRQQQHVLDPLVTLTLAAAVTDRIRLGTDVLVAPWYAPMLLARRPRRHRAEPRPPDQHVQRRRTRYHRP